MWLSELARFLEAIASAGSICLAVYFLERDFKDVKQGLRDIHAAVTQLSLDVREVKGAVFKASSQPSPHGGGDPPRYSSRGLAAIIGGVAVVLSVLNFFGALTMILIRFPLGVAVFTFFLIASVTGVYYSYYDEVRKAAISTAIGLAPWIYTVIVYLAVAA